MAVHRLRPSSEPFDASDLVERMERLRGDASRIANEHTNLLVKALSDAAAMAEQVANGGEAYHVGVREIARRTHSDLASTILSLRAVRERSH
jgi:hypothetical protein